MQSTLLRSERCPRHTSFEALGYAAACEDLEGSTGLLLETIPAKHRPVPPWTEWDSRVDSTLEAGRMSLGGFVLSRFPQSHARFATFWCVLETLVLKEDLLISREYERFAAVNTRKILVNEVHSLPIWLWKVLVFCVALI